MLLEKLSYENLDQCLNMNVSDTQKSYICANKVSLGHAFLALQDGNMIPFPFLLKEKETYVGFLMLSYCKADPLQPNQKNAYCIWRLMIDKNYQGRGYGKNAVKEAIELAKTHFAGPADTIVLFVEPKNQTAIHIYESYGFTPTDEIIDGEIKYKKIL